jgi:hypothetical protein
LYEPTPIAGSRRKGWFILGQPFHAW